LRRVTGVRLHNRIVMMIHNGSHVRLCSCFTQAPSGGAQHAGQPLLQPLIEVREPVVIQPHQVQNGRVQVGCVYRLLDGAEAELIGGADDLRGEKGSGGQVTFQRAGRAFLRHAARNESGRNSNPTNLTPFPERACRETHRENAEGGSSSHVLRLAGIVSRHGP
jgi:hypothetical protein